jgi:hypothetical protein
MIAVTDEPTTSIRVVRGNTSRKRRAVRDGNARRPHRATPNALPLSVAHNGDPEDAA